MKSCPQCGRTFDDHVQYCPIDGKTLSGTTAFGSGGRSAPGEVYAGLVLDKKYRLEKEIGRGGMGAVYRATHLMMDSLVAVKLLNKNLVEDEQAVERFRREARAAARIRHPNAVSVTDFGVTENGLVYLVMEYLEGSDLGSRLRGTARAPMPPDKVVQIMVQVCAAVAKAHSRGVIHRDLKPENVWILVDEDSGEERVKVLDFGIAKLKSQERTIANLTQNGTIMGTPQYMSPEQARGEDLDPRADIYSLGVMLYEMLGGKRPIDGPNPMAVAVRQSTEIPEPLRKVNPRVPAPLEAVVMRSLEKDRTKRQESAADLSRELLAAMHDAGSATLQIPKAALPENLDFAGDQDVSIPPDSSFPPELQQRRASPASMPAPASYQETHYRPNPAYPSYPPMTSWGAPPPPARSYATVVIAVMLTAIVLGGGVIGAFLLIPDKPPTQPTNASAVQRFVVPDGMVPINGGTFTMGTNDPKAPDEARPAREVTIEDFLIDATEVTNEQYAIFVRAKRYEAPPHWPNGEIPPGEGQLPVYNVTWNDATAYAEWAKKRLPTEAEWEYAARGTQNLLYPWGSDWSPKMSNSQEDDRNEPVAVRSYPGGASWAGVYDMAGNVGEWVDTDFAPYPGSKAKPVPNLKVYKGGAYNLDRNDLKLWNRYADYRIQRLGYVGFRCAMDAPKAP
jgi:serine/threonine-protein kinase